MAADITQAVKVVTLDGGFSTLPVPIGGTFGVVAAAVDMTALEPGDGGDGGGGGGEPCPPCPEPGDTRPTSGMIYPRGTG